MQSRGGVKRDLGGLRRRRLCAASLLAQGLSQAEVARRLGVSREAVRLWAAVLAERGLDELCHPSRLGRRPQLAPEDLSRISQALEAGPETLGLPTGPWTGQRVAALIERLYGVHHHRTHVCRMLHRLGWSFHRRRWEPAGGA